MNLLVGFFDQIVSVQKKLFGSGSDSVASVDNLMGYGQVDSTQGFATFFVKISFRTVMFDQVSVCGLNVT